MAADDELRLKVQLALCRDQDCQPFTCPTHCHLEAEGSSCVYRGDAIVAIAAVRQHDAEQLKGVL